MIWPVFQSIGQSVSKFRILGNAGLWLPSRLVHLLKILGPQLKISLHDVAKVTRELIAEICQSSSSLQTLKIPSPDFLDDEEFVSKLLPNALSCENWILMEECKHGGNTTNWSKKSRIQSGGFYSLMNCRKLETLNISRCLKLPTQFYKVLSEKCGSFLHTIIATSSNLSEEALDLILQGCGKLSRLDVAYCEGLTGVAFEKNQSRVARLGYLTIVGCRLFFNTDSVGVLFARILTRSSRLEIKIGPVTTGKEKNNWMLLANVETALVCFKNGRDWDGSFGRERHYELNSASLIELSRVLCCGSVNVDRMCLAPFRKLVEHE
jgi:hypothetical protein